jgi:hypothetical protein
MSISPFKFVRHLRDPQDNRLNLAQSLLITAGLAGLTGLLMGAVVRFSLSQSSNTRFLSPLQTFPELADWAPELPQGTADAHYLPGGQSAEGDSDLQTGNSLPEQGNSEFEGEGNWVPPTEDAAPETLPDYADYDAAPEAAVEEAPASIYADDGYGAEPETTSEYPQDYSNSADGYESPYPDESTGAADAYGSEDAQAYPPVEEPSPAEESYSEPEVQW